MNALTHSAKHHPTNQSRFKVYGAGPITGLTFDGAQHWRDFAESALAPDIAFYSPLRDQEHLRAHGLLDGSYDQDPTTTQRGLTERDHWDVMTADLILFNLLGSGSRVSQGSVMEAAWAYAYRKPTVFVMEPSDNIHDHPMVRETMTFRVTDLAKGIALVRHTLLH